MPKITLIIEDVGDEITLQGTVEPALDADKQIFSTAEIIGLYMQQNMSKIMGDAVLWARTPDEVKEPSLIVLPGAQL